MAEFYLKFESLTGSVGLINPYDFTIDVFLHFIMRQSLHVFTVRNHLSIVVWLLATGFLQIRTVTVEIMKTVFLFRNCENDTTVVLMDFHYLDSYFTKKQTKQKHYWLRTHFFLSNRPIKAAKGRNSCVYIQSFHPCCYYQTIPSTPNYLVFPQQPCYPQWHVFKCILSISSLREMTPIHLPSACQSLSVWPRKWELQMVSSPDDEARTAAMAGN